MLEESRASQSHNGNDDVDMSGSGDDDRQPRPSTSRGLIAAFSLVTSHHVCLFKQKESNHCMIRLGTVVRALASHCCGPGSIPGPGIMCGLSLLLVLVLPPRVFLRVVRFSV